MNHSVQGNKKLSYTLWPKEAFEIHLCRQILLKLLHRGKRQDCGKEEGGQIHKAIE